MDALQIISSSFSDEIADSACLIREGYTKLYIQPVLSADISVLRTKVESLLLDKGLKADCYFVSSLPYKGGVLDVNLLSKLPLISPSLLDSLADSEGLPRQTLSIGKSIIPVSLLHTSRLINKNLYFSSQSVDNENIQPVRYFSALSKDPSLLQGAFLAEETYNKSLGEALLESARKYPEHSITFINSLGTSSITYRELLNQARSILYSLKTQGLQQKDIVIFHLEASVSFITIFWACMLGGITILPIVPLKVINDNDVTIKNLTYLASEIGQLKIIGSEQIVNELISYSKRRKMFDMVGITIESLSTSNSIAELPPISPESESIILMTSGSTGRPKLVLHTHKSLMARSISTAKYNHFLSSDITLNWFGFDHVGALVMFHIRDVVLGATQIHIKTEHILEDPLRWLYYLSQYKVSVTWAPNFAYALILEKLNNVKQLDINLSSLRFILNGGESVNFEVASNFLVKLEEYKLNKNTMHPAWGMSETGSGVVYANDLSNAEGTNNGGYTAIGYPIPGCSVRIVDEVGKPVPLGYSGRLQVQSPSLMQGYLHDIKVNRSSFSEDGWFGTGDVAAFSNEGLCIVGREKDVLIINGQNYSCTNLENEIRKIKGVVPDCISLIPLLNSSTKKDDIILFVAISSSVDKKEVITMARQQLVTLTGLFPLTIILLKAEEFPKTSIGKIKKSTLKQLYLNGKFEKEVMFYDHLFNKDECIKDWFYEETWVEKPYPNPINGHISEKNMLVIVDFFDDSNNSLNILSSDKSGRTHVMNVREFLSTRDLTKGKYDLLIFIDYKDRQEIDIKLFNYRLENLYQISKKLSEENINLNCIHYIKVTSLAVNEANEGWLDNITTTFFRSFVAEKRNLKFSMAFVSKSLIGSFNIIDSVMDLPLFSMFEQKTYLAKDKYYVSKLNCLSMQEQSKVDALFSNDQFYVVTGGLGGIGYGLAKQLVHQGVHHILLIGRRQSKDIHNYDVLLKELNIKNGHILYISVDICSKEDLVSAIENYASEINKPLGAVFHTAGNFHTASVEEEDITSVEKLINPKVQGTLNLIEVCENFDNAELINFSSVNGYFGGAFVSAYSIANAFQDSLAYIYPFVRTFSWSMWHKIGMSEQVDFSELTKTKGFELLTMKQGLCSLIEGMLLNKRHILIGLDKSNHEINKLVNNEIYSLEGVFSTDKIYKKGGKEFADKLGNRFSINYKPEEPPQRIKVSQVSESDLDKIKEIWKRILKVDHVSDQENFFDLGGHSLLLPELQKAYENEFDITVSAVDIFKYPTIKLFSDHILSDISPSSSNNVVDKIKEIWQKALSIDTLALSDNFFDLGAHSLMLPKVQKMLSETLGVEISIVDIFKYPNIKSLSTHIIYLGDTSMKEETATSKISNLKRRAFNRYQQARKPEVVDQ